MTDPLDELERALDRWEFNRLIECEGLKRDTLARVIAELRALRAVEQAARSITHRSEALHAAIKALDRVRSDSNDRVREVRAALEALDRVRDSK